MPEARGAALIDMVVAVALCFIMAAIAVRHRSHQAKAVGHSGETRQVFGEPDPREGRRDCAKFPANFSGGIGLGIERIDVARTTLHEQENDAPSRRYFSPGRCRRRTRLRRFGR